MPQTHLIRKTQALPDAGLINHFFDFHHLALAGYPDKFTIFGQSEARSAMNHYSEIHNRFCLIVTLRGALTTVIEGVPFTTRQNQGILIFPYQDHTFPVEETDTVLFFVTFEQPDYSAINSLRSQIFELGTPQLPKQIEQMMDAFAHIECDPEEVWHFSRLLRQFLLNVTQFPVNKEVSLLFRKLKELFNQEEYMGWKVKEVANHFDRSAAQLNTICRQNLGVAIGEHLRTLRFNYAVKLICDTEMDIGEVAQRSGFQSFSSFCRQYKARFSQTPKETRHAFHKKEFRLRYNGFSESKS